jgi:hypothetical protein
LQLQVFPTTRHEESRLQPPFWLKTNGAILAGKQIVCADNLKEGVRKTEYVLFCVGYLVLPLGFELGASLRTIYDHPRTDDLDRATATPSLALRAHRQLRATGFLATALVVVLIERY